MAYRLAGSLNNPFGAIGRVITDIPAYAAGGTGTSRTSITTTYRIPNVAKELIAVCPIWVTDSMATAESGFAIFDIIGNNFNYQPQEVWFPISGSRLRTSASQMVGAWNWWEVHAPTVGGEQVDIGITPIDAIAGNTKATCCFMYSDQYSGIPPIFSKSARLTSTGTATGAVAGETLTLIGARQIIEVGAAMTRSTITDNENVQGRFILRSSAFNPVNEIIFPIEPLPPIGVGGATTSGGQELLLGPIRTPLNVLITSNRAEVTSELNLDAAGAPATAGQFAHYIRWI